MRAKRDTLVCLNRTHWCARRALSSRAHTLLARWRARFLVACQCTHVCVRVCKCARLPAAGAPAIARAPTPQLWATPGPPGLAHLPPARTAQPRQPPARPWPPAGRQRLSRGAAHPTFPPRARAPVCHHYVDDDADHGQQRVGVDQDARPAARLEAVPHLRAAPERAGTGSSKARAPAALPCLGRAAARPRTASEPLHQGRRGRARKAVAARSAGAACWPLRRARRRRQPGNGGRGRATCTAARGSMLAVSKHSASNPGHPRRLDGCTGCCARQVKERVRCWRPWVRAPSAAAARGPKGPWPRHQQASCKLESGVFSMGSGVRGDVAVSATCPAREQRLLEADGGMQMPEHWRTVWRHSDIIRAGCCSKRTQCGEIKWAATGCAR